MDWLNASLNFATDGFIGAQKIKTYPKILRPILARVLPEVRRIHNHYAVTRSAVKKILSDREGAKKKPDDFLQWMVEDAQGEEKNLDFIADILLKVSFAALHTSAATPMQLVYDLCLHREYIEPLRNEVEEITREFGGILDKRALGKMRKLDSFMKESLRFNPLLLSKSNRTIIEIGVGDIQLMRNSNFRAHYTSWFQSLRRLHHPCRNTCWRSISSNCYGP